MRNARLETVRATFVRNARFADSKRDSKPQLCPADLRGLGGKCVCVAPCNWRAKHAGVNAACRWRGG